MSINPLQDLTDENSETRRKAVEALAIIGNTDAVPHLMKALHNEPRLNVAIEIVRALGDLRDERAISALIEMVPTANQWRKGWAAAMASTQLQFTHIPEALAKIGNLEALLTWRNHEDQQTQRAVNTAIDRLSEHHRLSELL